MRRDSLLANYYYNKLPKSKKPLGNYGPGGETTDGCGPGYSKSFWGGCMPNGWVAPIKQQAGPTKEDVEKQQQINANYQIKKAIAEQRANGTYIEPNQGQQATLGVSRSDEPWRQRQAAEIRRQEAMKNTELAQFFAGLTPSGDINAGVIGANTFVNMTPGIGIIPASARLATLANSIGPNPSHAGESAYYSKDNSFGENALGVLNLAGDIGMLGTGSPFKTSGINISEGMPGVSLKGFNSEDLRKLAGILKRDLNMTQTPEVNVAGKKVYTLQMPSGSSQMATPQVITPQMNITKTPLAIPGGPNTGGISSSLQNGLSFLRDRKWFDYGIKSDNIQGISAKDLIQGRELGKPIGTGGGFNQGVFDLERFPGYVLKFEEPAQLAKSMQFPDYTSFDFVKAMESINNPNIAKVVHQIDLPNGQRALIMNKVEGTPLRKMNPADILALPNEAIEELYNNLKTLRNNNLAFDFIGENMVYDANKNHFQLFDINPVFTPAKKSIGLWDWNKDVLGGANKDIFGVEQSGQNLKDAVTRRFKQDYPIAAQNSGTLSSTAIDQGTKDLSDKLAKILAGMHHYQRGGIFADYFKKYQNGGLTTYQDKGEVKENNTPLMEGVTVESKLTPEQRLANIKNESTDYIQGWYNSPMYKQIFNEQLSPGEEWIKEGREKQLNNLDKIRWGITKDPSALGKLMKTNDLYINFNAIDNRPNSQTSQTAGETGVHELNHWVNNRGKLIPKNISDFIASIRTPADDYSKKHYNSFPSFSNTPFYKTEVGPYLKQKNDIFGLPHTTNWDEVDKRLKERNKEENWTYPITKDYRLVSEQYQNMKFMHDFYNSPGNETEQISLWNKIRQDAKELKLYDPFTEPFTEDTYNKFLKQGNTDKTRDFRELINWYGGDKEGMKKIIKGFNTIVKNDNNQSSDMAKYGGPMVNYMAGKMTGPNIFLKEELIKIN